MSASAVSTERPPVVLLYAITVTAITMNTLITPAIPDILDGLGVSATYAGVLVGAATLPGMLLAPVIGVAADRWGRREVLVPCLFIFGVAGGLGALAPNIWALAAARFVQGAGSAGLINLVVVIIGDHWSGTERAHYIGRNAAVLTVCLALFPLLGGVLTDLGGWRTVFLIYPVAIVTAVVMLRRMPQGRTRDASLAEQLREALPVLRSRYVLLIFATAFVLFALIFGMILTVLPVYAERAFGLGASWRGVVLALPAIGSSAVSANIGRLHARLGSRRLLLWSGGLFAVALVTLGVAPSVWLLGVGAVLFGIGEGMSLPTLQDLAAGAASDASRGTVVATWVSAARTGQTVGPLAASPALDRFGARAVYLAGAAFSLLAFIPTSAAAMEARPDEDEDEEPLLPEGAPEW